MPTRYFLPSLILALMLTVSADALAGGISADAGLTPAQDKWIFRTQMRYMQRDNDPTPMQRKSESYMFPVVVAYGLLPQLTVMVRQPIMKMNMTMGQMTTPTSGFGDLFVMAKYRAFRKNTRNYTLGIAPSVGLEFPTGESGFTSDGLDLKLGLNFSWRRGTWATDANLAYTLNGITGKKDSHYQQEKLEMVGALAHQFSIGRDARTALAPVLELSYENSTAQRLSGVEQANTGESCFRVSPGLKLTYTSIILETLLQVPVWQSQKGNQTEVGVGGLVGIRLMM
jgi:hypothetical protein